MRKHLYFALLSSIFLTSCISHAVRERDGIEGDNYGIILTQNYFYELGEKQKPPYSIISIDGESPSRMVEFFSVVDQVKVPVGEHTIVVRCWAHGTQNYMQRGEDKLSFFVEKQNAYFVSAKGFSKRAGTKDLGITCPGGTPYEYRNENNPDCHVLKKAIFSNVCNAFVGETPITEMSKLKKIIN